MLQELRHALRALSRAPSFTAIAVVTLALGIGAVTTALSWVEGLVLNPAPLVREPDRLVELSLRPKWGGGNGRTSYPDYLDVRARVRTLDGVAAFSMQPLGLAERVGTTADPVSGVYASENYFQVLGVRPALGRFFAPADSAAFTAEPSAVIGHGLWQRRWRGDPSVVGRRVLVNGEPVTVVGVAPEGFAGVSAGLGAEVWVPLAALDRLGSAPGMLEMRGAWWLESFGRVRAGATVQQAQAEVTALGERVTARYREHPEVGLQAVAFRGGSSQEVIRPLMAVLLGAAVVVMLLVCANVANLLLVRNAARERELGVCAALGAGGGRLARQLLAECALLAAAAAALGVVIAAWTRGALERLMPVGEIPFRIPAPLDGRVLAGTVAAAAAAVLLFGLAPTCGAARVDLATILRRGAAGAGGHRSRLRGALVVSQVALSLVALASAGLLVRSLASLRGVDPGFRGPEQVLLVGTDFGFAGVRDEARQRDAVARVLEEVRALPGVRAAGAATFVQMSVQGADATSARVVDGGDGADRQVTQVSRVTPGYFAALGMPILRGRPIGDEDRADAPPAVVVNETLARRLWPRMDPLGRRVEVGGDEAVVVGVARDGVYDFDGIGRPTGGFAYLAYAQGPAEGVTLHLRADGAPKALVPAVRSALAAVDPRLPVLRPRTLAEHASGAFFLQRTAATVLGLLGAVTAVLAALGVYGVVAYSVSRRTREIGIRAALGAAGRRIAGGFLRESLRMAAAGLLAGVLLALALGRLLHAQLPGVAAWDAATLAAAALALTACTLAATWIPARRAARVDPAVAIRSE